VLWGYGDADELQSAGVIHIAKNPVELRDLLLNSSGL
jgi:phosphoglycolate phosphatase-like HAD superfamily hydrolase